ncbi:hypothetical protein [Vibrio phage vB_VmeM-Yong XC32]|nr:hypothetical protein [Vibrio phage vB_VmeM-Yong XC31]QAX96318.1 hypothetical protein [Vibrio phage vB_VmeM-Yong XC32]QAX96636.1 hypothetical protein [Vibrio phage vB_VmeM-Yong MS31]QAX96954.1 hypothetical protein [Vibrio phage vB_VmeM-Yong MS32]
MAIFDKKRGQTPFSRIADAIDASHKLEEFQLGTDTVQNIVGFESLDFGGDKQIRLADTEASVIEALVNKGLREELAKHLGVSEEHPCVQAGMDAATTTLLAYQDPAAYTDAVIHAKKAGEGVRVFGDSTEISMEGYDDFKFEGFLGTAVVANALAAASNPFSETFFRTVVLAPTQNGVDVDVTNPLIYTKKARNANGSAYDLQKQSAVRALIDFNILAGHSTAIMPIATTAKAGILVATSDVPNRTVTLGGQNVEVRPLKYGVDVDLLAASTSEALLNAGAQDETDTVDPAMSLGRHYVKIVNGSNNAVVAINLDGHRGALFQATQEGSTRDLQVMFRGDVWVKSTDESVAGDKLEAALGLATTLGVTAADPWQFKLELEVSGLFSYVQGNLKLNFNGAKVGAAYVNGKVQVGSTEQAALEAAIGAGITGIGYEPKATRTNSNMRELGTVIDVSDTFRGRIPARMQSPLSIIAPTSVPGNQATMEAVNMIRRVRSSNDAVTKLLETEEQIQATDGILNGSPAIGALAGIKPTFLERKLDVVTQTVIFGSSRSMDELRGALAAGVTMLANKMLLDSGYLASLEMFTGSQANFEVIVGTDPQIANLLMNSGDNRTLGNGRNYHIASSLDDRLRGKIYLSVRRTGVDGADAHTFGVHPIMPSLIHKAQVTRNGAVSNETIVVPREEFAVTCPILARIDVLNLDGIFTEEI